MRGWKNLASDPSYPAGSGPWGMRGELQKPTSSWSVGNIGGVAAEGFQLPQRTVHYPSGRHPGSTPRERREDGGTVRTDVTGRNGKLQR